MKTTTTLFRPVGIKELELILVAKAKAFPPRLSWQPIFYPVLNEEYASEIASKWNTKDVNSGYSGFVTTFEIDSTYFQAFKPKNVGGQHHNELWIPAEELATFNQHINGRIQIKRVFYGQQYDGIIQYSQDFKGKTAQEQFNILQTRQDKLEYLVINNPIPIQINFPFWIKEKGVTNLFFCIKKIWDTYFPYQDLKVNSFFS